MPIIGSACFHPGYVDNGGDISPIDPEFPGDSVLSYFDACPEGYIQEGASALYCQLTGGWNTSLPTCIRRCFDPPVPMFGEIRIGGPKPIYLSGDSFLYICTIDSGSAFASYYNLRCNEDGEWTGNGLNIVCPGKQTIYRLRVPSFTANLVKTPCAMTTLHITCCIIVINME